MLKAAFKWTIFPKDNSRAFLMELIFDLYGGRGSGKSTTLEVLQAVSGNSFGVIKPSTLKPTEYFEGGIDSGDPFGVGSLGNRGMYRTIGEVGCTFFKGQGKITNLQ